MILSNPNHSMIVYPEVSLDFFFLTVVYIYGESSQVCKQEVANLKPNLPTLSELGKMHSLMFGKFGIFLLNRQNARLPFTRISVPIVPSFEVPYSRITAYF